jgi:hypothetical protein
MYLRKHRRKIGSETYEYWTLVESRRTASGPRQHTVATLGKLPGLDGSVRAGWESIDELLEGQAAPQQLPLAVPEQKDESESFQPLWREVDVRGVRVERVREFGEVYLALSLWRRLGLHTLLQELIPTGREEVPWERVACLLTVARFCAQPSELGIAERWYQRTALPDLMGVAWEQINEDRLYRGLDRLHAQKEQLTKHLLQKYQSWFGVRFEFLLYDVTSTFFEGQAVGNSKAARGYSRDSRADCKQVCIGLVVSPEGLPLAYEVFKGNRNDVTTVQEIVEMMEQKYGQAERIWVLDRGMVGEENIEYLRGRKAHYIVGTPKSQLRRFEAALLDGKDWKQVRSDVEVKLLAHPDGQGQEQFVLCRSLARREKEKAMLARQEQRLWQKLLEIHTTLQKKPAPADEVERRVGRWLGRYPAADKLFEVAVQRDASQQTSLRSGHSLPRGSQPMDAPSPRGLLAADQLRRAGSGSIMELVSAAAACRSRFPVRQERLRLKACFPSEDRAGRGAHPGLFPVSGLVAHTGNVDERQRAGHLRQATGGRDRHH